MKVLLTDTMPLAPELPAGWEAVVVDGRAPVPQEHRDARVSVVFGNNRKHLASLRDDVPDLAWLCGLMAGPDSLLNFGFDPKVTVTGGSGLHDVPVAEHTMGLLLAAARTMQIDVLNQQTATWDRDRAWVVPSVPGEFTMLRDSKIVIWGFGSIGRTVAPLLHPFGAEVVGVARSARTEDGVAVHTEDELPDLLADADALVMILPSTPDTHHALDAETLSHLPAHAWVVNVGRGATVDEAALAEALDAGRLGGAALDVFETEPLAEGSPLWRRDDVILTPHRAGGRPYGADEFLTDQFARYVEGRELRNHFPR